MSGEKTDRELNAIRTLINALEPLDKPARQRVMSYVFERLGISDLKEKSGFQSSAIIPHKEISETFDDIRSLKENKKPNNDSEMAAVVAYYLSEVAQGSEKKMFVTNSDIVKYFKQANYKLPKAPQMTLVVAQNAGYLDKISTGKYKLNPVGYNLVVHSLPRIKK